MKRSVTHRDHPQDELESPKETVQDASSDVADAKNAEKAVVQSGAAPDAASCSLAVDIYDQMYHLRGPDPKYLEQLSVLVDAKMRAVAQHGTTVDSLRVAVLAALNIADELVTLQQQRDSLAGNVAHNIKSRTETLAEMLDAVLEGNRKAG